MLTEAERKALVLDYFARINAGDVDKIMELWAPDASIEDPVGKVTRTGTEQLREFFTIVSQVQTHVVPGQICAAQDDRQVALALVATLRDPEDPGGRRLRIDCVDVFGVDDTGRLQDLRVYWGLGDVAPVDALAATDASAG